MVLLAQRKLVLALTISVLVGQAVVLQASEPSSARANDPWIPELAIEHYQLPNGLTVVLHEDHKSPLVAVNVIYNVGSKDEPPGRTGLAHLLEHLMFRGSKDNDGSYDWPIDFDRAGGRAWTERDRTVYPRTVTRNALEPVLWLEADRMGFLLPAVTEEKLANERNVVKMEREQNLDDLPLGEVAETLLRSLYPPGHPYRHLEYGSFDDVAAIRLSDVSAFYQKHYAPNNAFLCIAGDFKPALARRWIRKYFGPLRPRALAPSPEPVAAGSISARHITLTDRVGHPRVMLVWKTVPSYHPDEPALDVLASVLAGGSKSSRLFRALIDGRQIATQVSASHPTHKLAGRFELTLAAIDEAKLDELVRLVDGEIERLERDGPTAVELWRAKIERRRSQMEELESVASKAYLLNRFASSRGDPLAYRSELLKVCAVTSADVVRVAKQYLGKPRIRLDVLRGERSGRKYEGDDDPPEPNPAVNADRAPREVNVDRAPRNELFDRSIIPETAPTPRFVPPAIKTRRLSNGLEVHIVERHHLPRVIVKLVVRTGETSSPLGKEGLSSITVNLLAEGTKSRGCLQLEDDVDGAGATLATEGLLESSTVTLKTITRNLEQSLDLFADVILNPSFPDRGLLRLRQDWLGRLEDRSQEPEEIAQDLMPRLLYRSHHPYSRTWMGTLESVRSITRQDVVASHRRNFVPGNAALVVVGDVNPGAITAALDARFGKWPAGPVPPSSDLRLLPSPAGRQTIYVVDRPGTLQSVVSVGRIGTSVRGRAFYSLEILSKKLDDRINSNLLYEMGCSYGFDAILPRRNGAAPLVVTGSVDWPDTTVALLDIFSEMTDLAGSNPITESEIDTIRLRMVPTWFDRFETNAGVATEIANLVALGLSDRYWATEPLRYALVREGDAVQVAWQYFMPGAMTILVVGDRARIEPLLRSLPFVKTIQRLDSQGNPLPDPPRESKERASARFPFDPRRR